MFGALMKRSWIPLTLFLCAIGLPAPQRLAEAVEGLAEDKIRVLVITGGHGFEQEPFHQLFDAMTDVEATHATYPAAAELLNPGLAEKCDVIVFYDMWAQGIAPAQQEAFVKLLDSGIGVVALHHTMAAHANWPEYAKLIGGKFHLKDHVVDGKTVPCKWPIPTTQSLRG
jgi:hypothetical protein